MTLKKKNVSVHRKRGAIKNLHKFALNDAADTEMFSARQSGEADSGFSIPEYFNECVENRHGVNLHLHCTYVRLRCVEVAEAALRKLPGIMHSIGNTADNLILIGLSKTKIKGKCHHLHIVTCIIAPTAAHMEQSHKNCFIFYKITVFTLTLTRLRSATKPNESMPYQFVEAVSPKTQSMNNNYAFH